jgi:hypothetical protein
MNKNVFGVGMFTFAEDQEFSFAFAKFLSCEAGGIYPFLFAMNINTIE